MTDNFTNSTDQTHKPRLVYDGDCAFCRSWIDRCASAAGERVIFEPYQEACANSESLDEACCSKAVHFIDEQGQISTGADAVFRFLEFGLDRKAGRRLYQYVPGFAALSELGYRIVASQRRLLSILLWVLYGASFRKSRFLAARFVFIRCLCIIYAIAFLSLAVQILGLVGSDGILPLQDFFSADYHERARAPSIVPEAWRKYYANPTWLWFNASDQAIVGTCYAGVAVAALAFVRLAPGPSLLVCWFLYLSITVAGQRFLHFQWDNLLLETAFLAIWFVPWGLRPKMESERAPSRFIWFLLVWLLFRLMVSSGLVKLIHDHPADPTWRNLTALTFHYETQCIPNGIAWYMDKLPLWLQKFSTVSMFAIEIAVPLLFFLPRRLRHLGALLQILLQLVIIATGNYTWFNWLTITICLLLFDDDAWRVVLPKKWLGSWSIPRPAIRWWWPRTIVMSLFFLGMFSFSYLEMTKRVWPRRGVEPLPEYVYTYTAWYRPFRSMNNYGLFTNMTTVRNEIVIEGSVDGAEWHAYEFKYKPGRVDRMPPFVAPHQPRLDWQMWFAALRNPDRGYPRWFVSLLYTLLDGSPDVIALLENDPFPEVPPQYLRAALYRYEFTDKETRAQTGDWWKRSFVKNYTRIISR